MIRNSESVAFSHPTLGLNGMSQMTKGISVDEKNVMLLSTMDDD